MCPPQIHSSTDLIMQPVLLLLLIQCSLYHISASSFPNSPPGVRPACTRRTNEHILAAHRNKLHASSPVTRVVRLTIPLFVYCFQRVNSDDYDDINLRNHILVSCFMLALKLGLEGTGEVAAVACWLQVARFTFWKQTLGKQREGLGSSVKLSRCMVTS